MGQVCQICDTEKEQVGVRRTGAVRVRGDYWAHQVFPLHTAWLRKVPLIGKATAEPKQLKSERRYLRPERSQAEGRSSTKPWCRGLPAVFQEHQPTSVATREQEERWGNDSERATGMYISVCAHTHTPDVVRVSEVMVKTPAVSEEDGIHGGF